jgi:energy-coupling factor transporter ATP-binding protein EcfA2
MEQIIVQNLSYKYAGGNDYSIKNVNLNIRQGDFIIITGPSGSGKTTLCRCISGVIPHFYVGGKLNGKVIIFGNKVDRTSYLELVKHVGVIFSNAENQLFSLSVEKDIAFGLENLCLSPEEIKKRVDLALKIMNISEFRKRAPYNLSGGQQQKVVIASVLAMKPRIIVLDEPTTFLDPKTSYDLLKTINVLNRKLGVTIILVEQRLDMASQYADKIIIMKNGRIAQQGNPRDVFKKKIPYQLPKVVELYHELKNNIKFTEPVPLTPDEMSKIITRFIR